MNAQDTMMLAEAMRGTGDLGLVIWEDRDGDGAVTLTDYNITGNRICKSLS